MRSGWTGFPTYLLMDPSSGKYAPQIKLDSYRWEPIGGMREEVEMEKFPCKVSSVATLVRTTLDASTVSYCNLVPCG